MTEKVFDLRIPYSRVYADFDLEGEKMVILRPRFAAFKAIADGGFSREATVAAAVHYLVKPGNDYVITGKDDETFSARAVEMSDLLDKDGFSVIAIADAALEACGVTDDDDAPPEIEGDGYSSPIIYKLRWPLTVGDVTVTHIEFRARSYKVMRHVWQADSAGESIERFLRHAGRTIHDGGDEDIPMTGEIMGLIDGYDLASISAHVLPVFTQGGGKLRRRQTS